MSVYSFRGGPWNGFVIEYGERVRPDDAVRPAAADRAVEGLYLLSTGAGAYLWSAGPPRGGQDGR